MKKKTECSWLLCAAAILVASLGFTTKVSAEERFYLEDFTISAGETKELAIQFDSENVESYVAFQFDLYLPDGLSIVKNKGKYNFTFNTDRNDDHTFSSADRPDGSIRVVSASLNNYNFWEESGEFIYFTVTASESFSGVHEVFMRNIQFSNLAGVSTEFPDTKTIVTATVQGQAGLNIDSWATGVFTFGTVLPEGLQAFSCDEVVGDYLILEEVEAIEANTPYILFAEGGRYEGTLSGIVVETEEEIVTDGLLSGALTEQTITSGYVLQKQGEVCQFYLVNSDITIPSGKCWLNQTISNCNALRISHKTTEINAVENVETSDKIYTLDGKIEENTESGKMYIINGKKVIKL